MLYLTIFLQNWLFCIVNSHGKTKIVVDTNSNMVAVLFHDRVTLLVMRHLRTKPQLKAGKVHFLGFYIVDSKGLSYHTHGLLGKYFNSMVRANNLHKGEEFWL